MVINYREGGYNTLGEGGRASEVLPLQNKKRVGAVWKTF